MRRYISALCATALALPAIALATAPVQADEVADFYKGKTVEVLIGGSAGGGYDFYGRALARFIGNHIPGNPSVVAKNMPGAGTLLLANWLYNAGPKDGTAMGLIGRGIPLQKLLGKKSVKIDGNKYHWVGSLNKESSVCAVSDYAETKNFDDLLTKTTIVGGTGYTSNNVIFALFLKNVLGAKLRIIAGYPGTRQAALAMEKKEIDGICGWSWSSVMAQKRDWYEAGRLKVLVQMATEKHPDLPNVPLITELARNEREQKMMKALFLPERMGRPLALPPGTPLVRVAAIRKAFDDTIKDPAFLAYAEKVKMDLQPISGAEAQAIVATVLGTSAETIADLKQALSTKGNVEKASLSYVDVSGAIVEIKKKGRQLAIESGGKKVKTKVSGSRTKIFVNGKKAKRQAIKMGMTCTFTYLGPGTESTKIDCKS